MWTTDDAVNAVFLIYLKILIIMAFASGLDARPVPCITGQ